MADKTNKILEEKKYINIGKFAGTYGFKGELILKHALGISTSLSGLKALFVTEKNNEILPWFIESAKAKNAEEIFIKLEGVDSKETAAKFVHKEVLLTTEDLKKYASKNTAISLLGYTIFDNKTMLGTIEEVIEQPQQILCKILIKSKEAFIPLHEETLKTIDHKKKIVYTTLPEGLLDIYLS